METKSEAAPAPHIENRLDQLLLDCATLERLVASIQQTISALDPAIQAGNVTPAHVMKLALRMEHAELSLIDVAHQIDNMAIAVIERGNAITSVH